jgi:hydrogenase small subunit
LKFCAGSAAALGLSEASVPRIARALEQAAKKPPVIWLEGQSCTGCTISLISSVNPSVAELVLDTLSIRYSETIMAASGDQADMVFEETVKEGGYVLVVEGAIPTKDDRFCMIGDRPFRSMVEEAGKNAAAVIAVGACATFGGIPAAGPTGAVPASKIITGKPIINLSTCPVHPEHLVGSIVYFLLYGSAPALDAVGRPKLFFNQLIHENCTRRGRFENGQFLTDWNDPAQQDWCLYLKGCKGPITYSDCPIRKWNDGTNYCIECGAGCRGCAEPAFYSGMSPLYARTQEVGGTRVETIGKILAGATAVGIGAHFIGQAATGRLGSGGPKEG